jgi:magnesium-transporting ATPase (P-type)
MAAKGLRVLGVAKASLLDAPPPFLPPHPVLTPEHLPDQQHDFPFQFLGLVGLSDPVRPTVAAAIQECHTAGIRVVMITGDYPETAQTIARQVGLLQTGETITGAELDRMSDTELQQRIENTNIFARAIPEQKLRIVNALKDKGEVVAMTGDGVNDVRALTFTTLIIANLGLILSEGSTSRLSLKILNSPNPALWWVIGGGVFFMVIVLYIPLLRDLFSFSFLHSIDLAICFGGGAICLLWFELLKQTSKIRS